MKRIFYVDLPLLAIFVFVTGCVVIPTDVSTNRVFVTTHIATNIISRQFQIAPVVVSRGNGNANATSVKDLDTLRKRRDGCAGQRMATDFESKYVIKRDDQIGIDIPFEIKVISGVSETELKVDIENSKAISFGFFPGLIAEKYYRRHHSDIYSVNQYSKYYVDNPEGYRKARDPHGWQLMLPFSMIFGTLHAMLYEPFFGDYGCGSHGFYINPKIYEEWDSPQLQAFKQVFTNVEDTKRLKEELESEGFHMDSIEGTEPFSWARFNGTHKSALFGFHKFQRSNVVKAKQMNLHPIDKDKTEVIRGSLSGSYSVAIEIPSKRWFARKNVSEIGELATFELPKTAIKNETVTAYITVNCHRVSLSPINFGHDVYRDYETLNTAFFKDLVADLRHPFPVELKLPESPEAKSIIPGKQSNSEPLYEVHQISRDNMGRYVVKVVIHNQTQTFPIKSLIDPEVRNLVVTDFVDKNPSIPLEFVKSCLDIKTESKGNVLVYTGWAFSVRPVEDGWHYDHESRRGWMRLRIAGGMPAEEAKRWARENIAAIVADKNVALETGKTPPLGAIYRSLGESFENGVLTVEFEAVQ